MNTDRRKKPYKRLRIALVGCGRASAGHLKAIRFFERRGYVELAAIADRNREALEAVIAGRGRRFPVPLRADSVDEILGKTPIDLTVIATPPATHFSIAEKALRAGTHLIVEKPFTLDVGEAEQLIEYARERKRVMAVGMKYRYIPGVPEMKDLVGSGVLGEVLYGSVAVRWGHSQAYYDQAPWFGTWESEGGALMNQSIHAVDLMTWLMDAVPVEATGTLLRQCHQIEAADLAVGTLLLKNNRLLLIEGTTNSDPRRREASFFLRCERGTVNASVSGGIPKVTILGDGGRKYHRKLLADAVVNRVKREGIGVLKALGNPYTFMYGDILDAIEEGRPALASAEAGLAALRHILAVFQAGREKRTVPFPPEAFILSDMRGFFDQESVPATEPDDTVKKKTSPIEKQ